MLTWPLHSFGDAAGVIFGLSIVLVFPILGGLIWARKGGRFGAGLAIGFFGSWLGLILLLVFTPSGSWLSPAITRECEHCMEVIRREAKVCRSCGRDVQPWTHAEGKWWTKFDGAAWYLDERSEEWVQSDDEPVEL